MKYCTNCGGEIDGEVEGDIVVCPNCGMPVDNLTNMDVPLNAPAPQYTEPKPVDKKKKIIATVVWAVCVVIAGVCFALAFTL